MTGAEAAVRSRAAQGLPERIEDPATLARVATLLLAGSRHDREADRG